MQTLKIGLAVFSSICAIVGFFLYVRDIYSKQTKPHIYTWLIWTITQGTAVIGVWYGKGGSTCTICLSISATLVFLTFLYSVKNGIKNITRSDTLVLIITLLAIVVWWQLHNPILAIFMVSAIDAFGYIPSYRKSWIEPYSETLTAWAIFCVGNLSAILALKEYNFLTLTYLTTVVICNLMVLIILYFRRRARSIIGTS